MTLSSANLLRLLLQFVLLLAGARTLGEGARRLGQPEVLGELLAGVLLGPSLLGALLPGAFHALFPASGPEPLLLQLVADLGVILLLLLSGAEVDLDLVAQRARPALLVAAGGVAVPFAAGYGLAVVLPGGLVGPSGSRPVFDLFVATALSISAIPVIVKILLDMRLMRRDIGQLTVAAGVLNDMAGWFLLAGVVGFATARALPVTRIAVSVVGTLAFAAFLFTWGHRLMRALIVWVDDTFGGEGATTTAVLLVGLLGAAATQALHVEAFLGAFLVGVQLARIPRVRGEVAAHLRGMTLAVFAPVFFASAGLRVDVPSLLHPLLLLVAAAIVATACVGKFAGTYLGARLAGVGPWMALSLGAAMNARGAVEVIVATVGLQAGVLTVPMYSMIILMAVTTSVLAPPALRWSLRRTPADPREEERLRREAFASRSFVHGLRRMLVPVRDGRYALAAAEVVSHLAAGREVEAVALSAGHSLAPGVDTGVRAAARPPAAAGEQRADTARRVQWRFREVPAPQGVAAAILAEAARDYDLLVLGAPERRAGAGLFGGVVDPVVREAPCGVLVLQAPQWRGSGVRLRRIVVPTRGTAAERRGAELALALAHGTGATIAALHVVEPDALGRGGAAALRAEPRWAAHATGEIERLGREAFDLPVTRLVQFRDTATVSDAIVRGASSDGDLILLTARRRAAGGELYCGRTVDQVLRAARCPVAVLFEAAGPA